MGFPSGSVVKNLPANIGDTGLIPGPGQLSPCTKTTDPVLWSPEATTTEPVHLEPVFHDNRSHHKETPAHRSSE